MNLKDLKAAVAAIQTNHSILIYGPPKTGKTRLVATAAKIPEIQRIFWFDIENGVETLLNMGLTDEELSKVIVFKIPDTRENPVAIETILRALSAKQPIVICDMHGVAGCPSCKSAGTPFSLATCTHNDLVVFDSGSQLGDSALNGTMKGRDIGIKPTFDEYGLAGKWLGDVLSVVQQAHHTNFVIITHQIALEGDDGKDAIYPLMGTKNFSLKVAKYFGTVVYVDKKLNKHVAGSSSTYRGNVLTGSRVNAIMENAKEPSMKQILIDGGIIKPAPLNAEVSTNTVEAVVPVVPAAVVADASKPMTFAEKIAANKK